LARVNATLTLPPAPISRSRFLDEDARRRSLSRSDEQRRARERNAERERQERQAGGLRHGAVTIARRRAIVAFWELRTNCLLRADHA